ncbi:transcription termination factor MTERF2, chloroplastic, partial [Tanacetum coccineum]
VAYLKEFGLGNEDVGRLLAFRPQLMGCSIEERWKPLVKYLYYLGISRDGMRRILTVKPMVFCFDLESNIVQKVQFFRDIGVQEKGIASMLVKFPSLLTYSLYKKIRPVVIFLLTKAGVSRTDIGKVVGLGPELLGCSISKKLEPNVKYFLSLGIDLKTLGKMISDFPMLLRYNIDILRPKYRYLRRTMVRPLNDILEFPRFFSYSLEERIIPRHKILMDNRVNFKLRYMLSSTNDEFQLKVEAAVKRRQMFESGILNNIELDSPTDDSSEDETDTRLDIVNNLYDEGSVAEDLLAVVGGFPGEVTAASDRWFRDGDDMVVGDGVSL